MWQGIFFISILTVIDNISVSGENRFVWHFTSSYILKNSHTEKRLTFTHVLMLKCISKQKPHQLTPEGRSLVYLQQGHCFSSIRNDGILRHTTLWINWLTFDKTVVAEDEMIQQTTERVWAKSVTMGHRTSPDYLLLPPSYLLPPPYLPLKPHTYWI